VDVHKLDRIFKPQRIALVGVSENPNSVSGTVMRPSSAHASATSSSNRPTRR